MSFRKPPDNWFRAPMGAERVWIGISLLWCLVMFAMMPYWHFKGKQNSTGVSYKVEPADFANRVSKFVAAHKVGEDRGIPIVQPPPNSDVYLQAQMWTYYPILKLKKGQEYRIHVSSLDLQHGLSMLPMNMNFQILPGYDHVLTMTPTTSGTCHLICNEFCGIGHHLMTGKIIVEE